MISQSYPSPKRPCYEQRTLPTFQQKIFHSLTRAESKDSGSALRTDFILVNPSPSIYLGDTLGETQRGKNSFATVMSIQSMLGHPSTWLFYANLEDFEMTLFEIEYPSKFQIANPFKIWERLTVWVLTVSCHDIIVTQKAQIIVDQRFITLNPGWNSRLSYPRLSERPFSDIIESKTNIKKKETWIKFRLDTFLSSILKLSRSQT